MAKEIKLVKHYKVFIMFVLLDNNKSTVPIAVFDDIVLFNKYVASSKGLLNDKTVLAETQWTENEPKEENFNLPLNPKFEAEYVKSFDFEKLNQVLAPAQIHLTKAKKVITQDEDNSLVGIKIGRKGGASKELY